jgi:hypothetical protein
VKFELSPRVRNLSYFDCFDRETVAFELCALPSSYFAIDGRCEDSKDKRTNTRNGPTTGGRTPRFFSRPSISRSGLLQRDDGGSLRTELS